MHKVKDVISKIERAKSGTHRYLLDFPLSFFIKRDADTPLAMLDFPARAQTYFRRKGWEKVADLSALKVIDLMPNNDRSALNLMGNKNTAAVLRELNGGKNALAA